jgi:membrane protein DedA with SNARE-associated domain
MEAALLSFVRRFGLLAVMLGSATEGDGTMVVAGALAHLGYFHILLAIAAGCLGAFCADCMWYTLGRTRAKSIRSSRFYAQAGPAVERIAARLGLWQITVARFILGARIPSMIFWGMNEVPFVRFALLDALGCVLWGSVLAGLGYAFSGSLTMLVEELKRTEYHLAVAVAALVVVLLLRHRLRRRIERDLQPPPG